MRNGLTNGNVPLELLLTDIVLNLSTIQRILLVAVDPHWSTSQIHLRWVHRWIVIVMNWHDRNVTRHTIDQIIA